MIKNSDQFWNHNKLTEQKKESINQKVLKPDELKSSKTRWILEVLKPDEF